ncbi:pyridoxal phosphate-dependent transferase [Mycena albidolilacea]|uniref:Pyridoxal phosphate-dependent transferase n=1 Tax=Mycena albidolilacea TaxID=1033008 RepID=A0AAD7A672_9AGAR|nr:pyridoxal phosphate-dependent transferase [Mycena albidolilacea]
MDIEQFPKAGYAAIDRICDYYTTLESRPVSSTVKPGYLAPCCPPRRQKRARIGGIIEADYDRLIMPGLTHWQHPSFFAYFPTATSFESIIGELYANAAPHPGFNRLLALPAYAKSPPSPDVLVIYVTQTHSLGLKAGRMLGLQVRALEVTAEDMFALRGSVLHKALTEDKAAGRYPFVLIATVGSTSSVADHPEVWLHVDAAWAGLAPALPAINAAADSFTTNFHKWGFVTFDASTLWVRDRKALARALDITPPFLRTAHGNAGTVIDYRNWHLALGRRFRSLKLWFVLRGFGVEVLRKHVSQGITLNAAFAALPAQSDTLTLVTPPSLALTVFRLVPPDVDFKLDLEKLNTLNVAFFARLARRPDITITQTVLKGVFCVRFAVGAARTTEKHVRAAFDAIVEEAHATAQPM